MKPPARICLQLLGRFSLTCEGIAANPIRLSARKAGALVAYLAMRPDQTASREQLATLLWGDCSESQARQSLRQALATLRKELRSSQFFVTDNETVRLQPGLWLVDARTFEELTKSTRPEDLDQAARLFGGEFLSGYGNLDEEGFDDWLRDQRQRMQLAASRLGEAYAARPELVRDGEQAVGVVERLLALDPLREDWQRAALILYARYRGKAEALAQAEAFAGVLKRELDVAPEPETRALIERIRAGDIAPAAIGGPTAAAISRPPQAETTPQPEPHEQTQTTAPAPARPSSLRGGRRGIAVGAALAAIALAAAFWSVIHLRATAPRGADPLVAATGPGTQAAGIPLARLWQSPPLPSAPGALPLGEMKKDIIPIIVLPFKTFGESAGSTELLADMVTDDLINLLSRVQFMRVISRQTAATFKGQPVDVAAIGAELQVKYVLDGSMRMHGDMLRVNVELIDPTTRLPVWTSRIEREGADRYDVQDEIVGRLARELQFEIIPIESARRSNDHDAAALAYQGWATLTRVSLEGYKQALIYFQQALDRDPLNLSAQIGVGAYHARMGAQVLDNEPAVHRAKARDILQDAIRRDPQSSTGYFYLGLALNLAPTLPQAMDAFERAIELDPSNASAHGQIGNALIRSGHAAEGLEHARYAMRLSPRDPILEVWLEFAGNGELELGQYPQAIDYFQRAATLNPTYPRVWAGLAAAHALAGQDTQARDYADRLRTFQPDLDTEALIKQFGRAENSRLHEGLRLAFAAPADR